MTTEQLRVILAVAESGSILKASKRLYLAQPTVSATVAAVEREIGFPIFERSNRGISVTSRGSELLLHARRIAAELSEINEIGKTGELCRLHLITFNSVRIEDAFERFCMRHRNANRMDLSYRLTNNGLDRRAVMVYDG